MGSYSTFEDAENIYFVLEYLPGGEIYNIVRVHLKSDYDSILFYMAEVASALEFLHSHDIAYRDLKCENVLIDKHGHARITDLGFAKHMPRNRTNTICGTPGYLSPEQLQKREYGKEVDIWAYGVLLFELLAGYNPFFDRNPKKLYENIVGLKIKWPPYMKKVARDFIEKLLVSEPAHRLPVKDFKNEEFFMGINWEKLEEESLPVPYAPQLQSSYDTAYFQNQKHPKDLLHNF